MATLDSKKTSDPEAQSTLLAENTFDMDVESGAVHNSQCKPVNLAARLRDSVFSKEFREFVHISIPVLAAINAFFGAIALVLNCSGLKDVDAWLFFKSIWIFFNAAPFAVLAAVGMYKLMRLII